MRKKRSVSTITRYLPVLIILIAITIMVGSTLAYFTDKEQSESTLKFSKVELSSDTQVGYDGTLNDVIPGDSLIKEPLMVSKAIDSEAVYIRAKLSFTYAQDATEAEKTLLKPYLKALRESNDFNILSEVQGSGASAAKWSAKDGNYIYLMENTSEGEPVALKRVEDNTIYTLSNNITLPRDLEQLEDENGNHAQYGKKIVFNIAFQAIQADNVTTNVAGVKELFDITFPELDAEKAKIIVDMAIKSEDGFEITPLSLNSDGTLSKPTISLEQLGNDKAFTGRFYKNYSNGVYSDEFEDFTEPITQDLRLYAEILPATDGLVYHLLTDKYMIGTGSTTYGNGLIEEKRNSVTNLVIPAYHEGLPVVYVSKNAFYNCATIERISLPDTLIAIRENAFSYCSGFEELVLPDSLTTIDKYAFSNCYGLEKVVLPDNLTSVGDGVFSSCSSLTAINLDKLTSIPNSFLSRCSSIKFMDIPNTITSIGSSAFYMCSDLMSITIPESVQSVGSQMLSTCPKLVQVRNYSGLSLDNCSIGSNLDLEIVEGDAPFANSLELVNEKYYIYTAGANVHFMGMSGNQAAAEDIPSNVTHFYTQAFYSNEYINSVVIPEGTTTIGAEAFHYCSNLMNLTIASTVTTTGGSNAFGHCPKLVHVTKLTTSSSIKVRSVADQEVINGSGTFVNELNVVNNKYVTYKVGDDKLYLMGFYGDQKDASDIPNNITHIYESAFESSDVSVINIPNSVVRVGRSAFAGADKLKKNIYDNAEYIGNEENPYIILIKAIDSSITSCNINTNCKIIYDTAFYQTLLTDVVIPSSVLQISNAAFRLCSKLENVTFNEGLEEIIGDAFQGCKKLTAANLPDSLLTIPSYAFQTCSGLTTISIGKNVTYIGDSAFTECTGVTTLNYNAKNVADFGSSDNNVFKNLGSAGAGVTVVIGEDVESIPAYFMRPGYSSTANVISLTIGSNVTKIGKYAFSGLSKLATLNYNAKNVADFAYNTGDVFYNCGTSVGGFVLNIGADVERIPNSLFYVGNNQPKPAKVSSINFASGSKCKSIGSSAFYNVTGFTSITLPDGLETISAAAFTGCADLTSLVIPSSVTSIGSNIVRGCTSLTTLSVAAGNSTYDSRNNCNAIIETTSNTLIAGCSGTVIPDDIVAIAEYAFYGCTGLTSVTIPSGVTSIGNDAFYDCKGLTSIQFNATNLPSLASSNYAFYNAGISGDGITLTFGAAVQVVPENLFYQSYSNSTAPKIISVVFEEGSVCTSIGSYAFYHCKYLQNVTIPSGVTQIGKGAFYGCIVMTSIQYNATNLSSAGYQNNIFYNCGKNSTGITVTIGAGVTTIASYLFNPYNNSSYAPKITSVIFEEGSVCATIGSSAFGYCNSLKSIVLPDSITTINSGAFSSTNNAYVLCGNDTVAGFANGKGSTNVYVVDTATDFSAITFTDATSGAVNGTYNDGTNYYVRTGESTNYVYYKKYTA